jgi:ribose transport system permease protein
MKFMVFGRSVHALGTNLLAARYSGVNVAGTLISVYVISAVMAGLTGLLLCGYAGTSYLTTGDTYNMDSIAAVVIGGTSILGGKGSYVGSVGGAVIMTVLTSLLIMISVPESVRQILQGAIIIGMLLIVHGKNKN